MVDIRELVQSGEGGEEGLPNDVKNWIDDKVHRAGLKIYRGGLQVLASGFGKGLVAAAALTTVAIVVGFVLQGNLPVANLVKEGLMAAGNFLLGSAGGATVLAGGGLLGAVVETQRENTRINKEMAEAEARRFETLRSFKDSHSLGLTPAQPSQEPEECVGHCAKLLQARAAEQSRAKGGIA